MSGLKKNRRREATMAASVRDVVARASHHREVVAIVRAASSEFVSKFGGLGHQLLELLLQRDGQGARPASVEAILQAEAALEQLARELETRAETMLSAPVECSEAIDHLHVVACVGPDHVVHRDGLEKRLRPHLETTKS